MTNQPNENLSIAALERIDDICVKFEAELRAGESPQIESLLDAVAGPGERAALLAEVLGLEFDYRRRQGQTLEQESYLQRFPSDADVVEAAFEASMPAAAKSRFELPTQEVLAAKFPKLEILGFIGAGGMGAVYKARQTGLDRVVALKVLPDEIGRDVKFALRFTREARALARLSHPHIVSVFEFGSADGLYYFLMEYVDGSTLRDCLRTGELKPTEALAIVPNICDALQYAHDNGIVHRDIKPENILLDREGNVKIADFGLARLIGNEGAEATLTATHQVMGSLRYMAPEQMEGSKGVDHRADIYSLGVVFYEMLTGELPVGRFEVPSHKAQIDVRLDEVVLRTLEREPIRRYQHVSEVKTDVLSITDSALQVAPEQGADRALGLAETQLDHSAAKRSSSSSARDQEDAARLLVLRRELLGRVKQSFRPLFWGQVIQMILGTAIIPLGAYCWTNNFSVPTLLASGLVVHVFGVLHIVRGGLLTSKITKLDLTQSMDQVRSQIESIRAAYLFNGVYLGLPWWVLWLPVSLAAGYVCGVYRYWTPSYVWETGIGCCVGMLINAGILLWVKRRRPQAWQKTLAAFSGRSIPKAIQELEQVAKVLD